MPARAFFLRGHQGPFRSARPCRETGHSECARSRAPPAPAYGLRLKAGFSSGEPVSFKVSKRAITIVPKLTLDEIEDEREPHDPKVRRIIRKGYQKFLDGKGRPIEELFVKRSAHPSKPSRSKA
jgi:hypothetical protein